MPRLFALRCRLLCHDDADISRDTRQLLPRYCARAGFDMLMMVATRPLHTLLYYASASDAAYVDDIRYRKRDSIRAMLQLCASLMLRERL